MTNYRVHIISSDGVNVSRRTENNRPDDFAFVLIATELAAYHKDVMMQTLIGMVEDHCCRMGYQVAFVDEDFTVVVTELH